MCEIKEEACVGTGFCLTDSHMLVYFRRVDLQGRASRSKGSRMRGSFLCTGGKLRTYPRINPEHEAVLHFNDCLL